MNGLFIKCLIYVAYWARAAGAIWSSKSLTGNPRLILTPTQKIENITVVDD